MDQETAPQPAAVLVSRFKDYFEKDVAKSASKSLSNGIAIEFKIRDTGEIFYFTKVKGEPETISGPAPSPEVVFSLGSTSAAEILDHPQDSIAQTGIQIAKLIVSSDPQLRIGVEIKAGVFNLLSKGYFGVITAGGAGFATFLASKGLNGLDGIKTAIKKMRGN